MESLDLSETRISYRYFKLAVLVILTWILLEDFPRPPIPGKGELPLPFAAILLNFAVSGWVVVANKFFDFPRLNYYFRIRDFERRLFERAGVRFFQKIVRTKWYYHFWGPSLTREGKEKPLLGLVADMLLAETAHIVAFLLIGLGFIYCMGQGWEIFGMWLLSFNILINIYPVMLQRYNRRRIEKLILRENRKKRRTEVPVS